LKWWHENHKSEKLVWDQADLLPPFHQISQKRSRSKQAFNMRQNITESKNMIQGNQKNRETMDGEQKAIKINKKDQKNADHLRYREERMLIN
jgi:hypothetical protein